MSFFYKVAWFIRAVIYKLFFKKIGNRCVFGKPIFIYGEKNIVIGNKVRIFPHARMEAHYSGSIIFEDNISIGQGLHIISGYKNLVIGQGTTISSNVFISNIDHQYDDINTPISEQPLSYSETKIGENCFLGIGARILPGSQLGKHCIVGANSVVKGVFEDYSVIVGNPGVVVKKFNPNSAQWEKL